MLKLGRYPPQKIQSSHLKRVNLSRAPFVTLLYPCTLDVWRAMRATRIISRVTRGDHIVNDKNCTVTDATIDFFSFLFVRTCNSFTLFSPSTDHGGSCISGSLEAFTCPQKFKQDTYLPCLFAFEHKHSHSQHF